MDSEKDGVVKVAQHEEGTQAEMGHLANEEDHQTSKLQCIKQNPYAFGWCLFAVWCTLLVSYENQAGGIVIGIPQFREDFGSYYQGNWVLPANWQSAFSGAPVAATAIGALTTGQVADWLGRKKGII